MEISDTLKASLSPAVLLFLYLLSLRDDLSNENIQLIALIMKNCFPARESARGSAVRPWRSTGRCPGVEERGRQVARPRDRPGIRVRENERAPSTGIPRPSSWTGISPTKPSRKCVLRRLPRRLDALRRRLCLRTRACGSRERRKPRHPVPLRVHSRPRSRRKAGRPSTALRRGKQSPRPWRHRICREALPRGQQRRADEATGGPRRRGSRTAARRQPHSCPAAPGKVGSRAGFHFLAPPVCAAALVAIALFLVPAGRGPRGTPPVSPAGADVPAVPALQSPSPTPQPSPAAPPAPSPPGNDDLHGALRSQPVEDFRVNEPRPLAATVEGGLTSFRRPSR